MRGDRRSWLGRHLVLACTLALVAGGALAYGVANAVDWSAFSRWGSAAERVAEVRPSGRPAATVVVTYRYRERTRTLTVPVSQQELDADRAIPTDVVFSGRPELVSAYLGGLVRTQSRAPSVESMARQLRVVRRQLRLDSDEYVELMACVAQDVPYGKPRPDFRLPAQMLLAGRGVCVDKSLLLAALLVHEGYDAGMWSLPTKNHVAVALRGTGEGFLESGYMFVETTQRAYVGEVPEEFSGRYPSNDAPLLATAGGVRRYHAECETAFLVSEQRNASAVANALEPYRAQADESTTPSRRVYGNAAQRQVLASVIAARLAWASDDRTEAFRALETLNGWSRPDERL